MTQSMVSFSSPAECLFNLIQLKFLPPASYKESGLLVINPSNPQFLSESFVVSTLSKSVETWDSATSRELFNNAYQINYSAQPGIRDGKNTFGFTFYPNNNVIAVTSVWMTFTGQIVEADIQFNNVFTWGDATLNPNVMDLENIGVHEIGHVDGLGDIYSSSCSSVTMYGYSDYGETAKRTLETPDITGLRKLYGN